MMVIRNPVGVQLDQNAAAHTFTSNAVTVLRYFEPRVDTLDFDDTPYRTLRFALHFVQYWPASNSFSFGSAERARSVSPLPRSAVDRL
jgi:hypothetical protein